MAKWTKEEIQVLLSLYGKMPYKDMMAELPGRTEEAIASQIRHLRAAGKLYKLTREQVNQYNSTASTAIHVSVQIPLLRFSPDVEQKVRQTITRKLKERVRPSDFSGDLEEFGYTDINYLAMSGAYNHGHRGVPEKTITQLEKELRKATGIHRLKVEQFEE